MKVSAQQSVLVPVGSIHSFGSGSIHVAVSTSGEVEWRGEPLFLDGRSGFVDIEYREVRLAPGATVRATVAAHPGGGEVLEYVGTDGSSDPIPTVGLPGGRLVPFAGARWRNLTKPVTLHGLLVEVRSMGPNLLCTEVEVEARLRKLFEPGDRVATRVIKFVVGDSRPNSVERCQDLPSLKSLPEWEVWKAAVQASGLVVDILETHQDEWSGRWTVTARLNHPDAVKAHA
ncbi:hypothetical protein OWM54_42930 [Myxococcus sp. MISCRS1]|uniref:hypothetical protein n=1 Tax=Myxococcus sp. MISCRS1 TaxID=2996786 RepID=UPI00226FFFF7|nr:hypothetical protein [Myxococcus sp. MISCRS1]MCY1003920.1 hypothetical protein [Myxococcus sp. MISCRS1]